MKKDNAAKKFIITVIVSVCMFCLFAGVKISQSNTKRSLTGEYDTIITQGDVASEIRKFLSENKIIRFTISR